jgi:5-formyltetrahydrofolate cyclo-ligase
LRAGFRRWLGDQEITTVCSYVPVGDEPGTGLLDDLLTAGCRVLLPVVVGAAPLDWADYSGREALRAARFGLLEPTGPRLGPEVLGRVDVILVPALAVDHQGVRLGQGGGHYDRSLPLAAAETRLIGVVRDTEWVSELPSEDHDVRLTAVLTPSRGVVRLPL